MLLKIQYSSEKRSNNKNTHWNIFCLEIRKEFPMCHMWSGAELNFYYELKYTKRALCFYLMFAVCTKYLCTSYGKMPLRVLSKQKKSYNHCILFIFCGVWIILFIVFIYFFYFYFIFMLFFCFSLDSRLLFLSVGFRVYRLLWVPIVPVAQLWIITSTWVQNTLFFLQWATNSIWTTVNSCVFISICRDYFECFILDFFVGNLRWIDLRVLGKNHE